MPIYDRPVWKLMGEEAAPQLQEPFTIRDVVEWFNDNYPAVQPSTVRAHVIAMTVNHESHYTVPAAASPIFFRRADGLLEHYDPDTHIATNGEPTGESDVGEERAHPSEEVAQFALEAQLEAFLASNWNAIDWGRPLKIWTN